MSTLGVKLRDIRSNRGLTLKQVADETGLSVSFLSLLERDKVSISVGHLEQLARYYQVRLVNLFQGIQDSSILITRKKQLEEETQKNSAGKTSFILLGPRDSTRMEPLLVHISPGHGDTQYRTTEGEMLLFVLKGTVRLLSEREEDFILEEGDSAYFPGYPGHRIINASQEHSATILLVTAPPTTLRDDFLDRRQGILLQSET